MGQVFQTSKLPGARHELPKGSKCDCHPERDAVANIQGETDSFGCETLFCCQECVDEISTYNRSEEARTGVCDWCKASVTDLGDMRDIDEGLHGPVYRVCAGCRKRRNDEIAAELDAYYDED